MAAAAAGFALQGFGNLKAAQAQEASLREDAARARDNAELEKIKTQSDVDALMLQSMKVLSSQKTGFSAAGLSGESAMAVMFDSRVNAELDRLSVVFGGDVRSRNFELEAISKERAAKDIRAAGLLNVLGTGFRAAAAQQRSETPTPTQTEGA